MNKGWLLLIIVLALCFLGVAIWILSTGLKMESSFTGLHPKVKQASQKLIAISLQKGIKVKIIAGFRSQERQNELYAQGRTTPGKIVTHAKAGQSFHNYGLAIDFALMDPKTNELSWNTKADHNHNGISDWNEVVKEAKKLGFEWGGDWENFKDMPHLEMNFGQSIRELQFKSKIWGKGKDEKSQ